MLPEFPTAPALPIYAIAVLSTAHITRTDNDLLEIGGCPCVLATDENGFWLQIPSTDFPHLPFADRLQELRDFGLSDALIHLIQTCSDQSIHYLRLDSLGDELEELPTHDW